MKIDLRHTREKNRRFEKPERIIVCEREFNDKKKINDCGCRNKVSPYIQKQHVATVKFGRRFFRTHPCPPSNAPLAKLGTGSRLLPETGGVDWGGNYCPKCKR